VGCSTSRTPPFPATAGIFTHRRTWFAASSAGARGTDGAGHAVGAVFARGADGAGGTLEESPEAGVRSLQDPRAGKALGSCQRARQATQGGFKDGGASSSSPLPERHGQDLPWDRRDPRDQQHLGLQKDPEEEAGVGGYGCTPSTEGCSALSKAFARAQGFLRGRGDTEGCQLPGKKRGGLRAGLPKTALTGGPGRPCSPVKPRWPFSPLSPASPVSPLSPRGPWGPWKGRRGRVRLRVTDPRPTRPRTPCMAHGTPR